MKKRKKTWDEKVLLVDASWNRTQDINAFPHTFYQNLFFLKPSLKEHFKDTDFEHQHKAIIHGVSILMGFLKDRDGHPRQQILRLSRTHSKQGMNIHPHDYYYWIEALVMTLKKHDPAWYDDLAFYWREVIFFPVSFIISQYFSPID